MSAFSLHESRLLGERYYSTEHESGLPILVLPKKMSATHAIFAVNYGGADNLTENGSLVFPEGTAHFLEHKLFENADGSDSFERFAAFGADANAYTASNRTVYLFSCTDHFAESLGELLDFVTHPHFTSASVAKEWGIIAEEIRMCRDDPYDRCMRNMVTGLYHLHPVRGEICGTEASIASITDQTLYNAYRAYYRLSNMALVVCGDVTPDEVLAVANAHLKAADRTPAPARPRFPEPTAVRSARTAVKGQVAKPLFAIGVKDTNAPEDPLASMRRDAAGEILSELLFSDTGELYNRLLDEGMISPEFSSGYTVTRDYGFLRISGEADDPEAVFAKIRSYLEKVLKDGFTDEEVEHCRRIVFADYIKGFDSTEEIADDLVAFLFEGVDIFDYPAAIESVTREELEALARDLFRPEAFTLSTVSP